MKKTTIINIALITFLMYCQCFGQTHQWVKQLGGNNSVYDRSIAVSGSGNIYITGWFSGTVDFDPGQGTANLDADDESAFICKLDASGNYLWARQFGGKFNSVYGHAIAVDNAENVYTTGYFIGVTPDFDPGPDTFYLEAWSTMGQNRETFVSKLDAAGNFVYAKQLGGPARDYGLSIDVDASGNAYITGFFNDTADFDPGPGSYELASAGGSDIFVSKLDVSGNFVWAKQMGGTTNDFLTEESGSCIAIDGSGNIYVTGYFTDTVDFNPDTAEADTFYLTSMGLQDIFVTKLDASGNFVWAKQMGGTSYDYGRSIAIDFYGNVYTTGEFMGTADFDPGPGTTSFTAGSFDDVFINKLDSDGNFVWATAMGSSDDDQGKSIAVDDSGNVYTIGHFKSTVDFDPGTGVYSMTSEGYSDGFVQKLDGTGNLV